MSVVLPSFSLPGLEVRKRRRFGPFRLGVSIPWLLLASALRVAAYLNPNPAGLVSWIAADLIMMLAFMLVARRELEIVQGRTLLDRLTFRQEVALVLRTMLPVFLFLIGLAILFHVLRLSAFAPQPILAIDGIAFDQGSDTGRLWSSAVACLVLVMVASADETAKPRLFASLREIGRRAGWLVPAILMVACLQFALSPVQDRARDVLRAFHADPAIPTLLKTGSFYLFVVGFAALRLWLTVTVLALGIRFSGRPVTAFAEIEPPIDWNRPVLRFEIWLWPQILMGALLAAASLYSLWGTADILLHDKPMSGRWKGMNDLPSYVRALLFLPIVLTLFGFTWSWFRTRVFVPQVVELTKDALRIGFQNGGKPIPWKRITAIDVDAQRISISAPGLELSRLDGRKASINRLFLKGRRAECANAVVKYWERYR